MISFFLSSSEILFYLSLVFIGPVFGTVEWVGYLQGDAKYGMLLMGSVCILSWVVGAFAVG